MMLNLNTHKLFYDGFTIFSFSYFLRIRNNRIIIIMENNSNNRNAANKKGRKLTLLKLTPVEEEVTYTTRKINLKNLKIITICRLYDPCLGYSIINLLEQFQIISLEILCENLGLKLTWWLAFHQRFEQGFIIPWVLSTQLIRLICLYCLNLN